MNKEQESKKKISVKNLNNSLNLMQLQHFSFYFSPTFFFFLIIDTKLFTFLHISLKILALICPLGGGILTWDLVLSSGLFLNWSSIVFLNYLEVGEMCKRISWGTEEGSGELGDVIYVLNGGMILIGQSRSPHNAMTWQDISIFRVLNA